MSEIRLVSSTLLIAAALSACAAPGGDGQVGEATEAISDVCPAVSVSGVDIASYQHPNGAGIDWGAVAQSQKFVIIKATEGNGYTNGYYAGDIAGARAAGLVAGAYHFLAPSSVTGVSGAAQAQYYLAHASIQACDLPPMLDVETSSSYGSVLPSVADITGWLSTVEAATGVKPIIYIGYYVIGDLGTPSELSGYSINVPNYSSCPSYPDGWPQQNLVMWQKTSTASVPGISGNVDQDEFYGDLAALQAFAHADQAATGYLDHAGCDAIAGWGWDPDNQAASTNVDVYFNGPAGAAGAPGVRNAANVSRADLCTALGSCNHAFSMPTPRSLFDGAPHDVHAYAIDLNGSENGELHQSPATITCAPLALPAGTVKRWIENPTVLGQWKFDTFTDNAPVAQSAIDAEPTGASIADGPNCVQADDGTPEVWVIDQGLRRHVINPDSLTAWRFTVAKTAAATVYANPKGPDWPATPELVQGTAANVYLLDVPIPGQGGEGGGGGSGVGGGSGSSESTGAGSHHGGSSSSTASGAAHAGGPESGNGSNPGDDDSGAGGGGEDDTQGGKASGCSAAHGSATEGAWLSIAALALAVAAHRRRSRRFAQ